METNLILLIVLVLALSQVVMAVYFFFSRQNTFINERSTDTRDLELLHDAVKKSQVIIGDSELEAIKQEADARFRTSKLEKKYEEEMGMDVSEVLQTIKAETAKAGENYKKSLASDLEEIKNLRKQVEEEIKMSVDQIVSDFDQNLGQAIKVAQDQVQKDLLVYQKKREKQIDENAETVIERAVEVYLGKKLDRKDHMQLIFEALERAKAEKVI